MQTAGCASPSSPFSPLLSCVAGFGQQGSSSQPVTPPEVPGPGLLLTYAMRRAAANYKMFALPHFPHITQVMSCCPLRVP